MREACHLLTGLTIFDCSNMLRWKLSLKIDMNDMLPLPGRLIL
jgi:hypothetical protein